MWKQGTLSYLPDWVRHFRLAGVCWLKMVLLHDMDGKLPEKRGRRGGRFSLKSVQILACLLGAFGFNKVSRQHTYVVSFQGVAR